MADILANVDKIERESVTQKIISTLRSHMVSGEIRPGTRLVESRLAEQLGVSRAPLREAFLVLENEGLLRSERGRGTYVSEMSEDKCREIYALRAVLEGLAARLATQHATEEQLDQLSQIVQEMQEAARRSDTRRVIELDLEFHEFTWKLSGSECLRKVLHDMIGPVRMFLAVNTQAYRDLAGNALRHKSLLDVMSSGDADKAQEMTIKHIEDAGETKIAYIREMGRTA